MTHTATIKPAAREWIAAADGIGHSQPVHGRERTACNSPRIDPRFAHPRREFCGACLDVEGVTVPRVGR